MRLTTSELAAATAGGDDYIRTFNNEVRGLALRLDLNDEAPDVVVVGKGPRIVTRAKLFLATGNAVPTYVKRGVNSWEYLGEYRATAYRDDEASIVRYHGRRDREQVAGILFLESAREPKVQVTGGGYADIETRREIEKAAIEAATEDLRKQGFTVHDRQRENLGYDLLANSATESLLVEVKGTDSATPRFFLTRNEWTCAQLQQNWRLVVVCQARTDPRLSEYTYADVERLFERAPLAWECTPR